ncbi:hypothetical protein [Motilibacter aurantiacus]|uniref:hypothetical protein n=1 Tax=Motilibacter aurantiacus TaxID=2714955 RepID=UPI00140E663B|nr:hypothetical protein [Motilibacter aurantiacus]NHC47223.1 hypothetical protein [Motilibacter aurantiacus]
MASSRFQFFDRGRGIEWRLVSANNRELGRAARSYPLLPDTVAAVDALRAEADAAVHWLEQDESGRWRWKASLRGEVVAAASRDYLRRAECEAALGLFRDAARTATAQPVVHRFLPAVGTPARAQELLDTARRRVRVQS